MMQQKVDDAGIVLGRNIWRLRRWEAARCRRVPLRLPLLSWKPDARHRDYLFR